MGKAAEEVIRERAYRIWETEGRPHGKHDEHWKKASEEVHGLEDLPGAEEHGEAVSPAGAGRAKRAAPRPKAPADGKT